MNGKVYRFIFCYSVIDSIFSYKLVLTLNHKIFLVEWTSIFIFMGFLAGNYEKYFLDVLVPLLEGPPGRLWGPQN